MLRLLARIIHVGCRLSDFPRGALTRSSPLTAASVVMVDIGFLLEDRVGLVRPRVACLHPPRYAPPAITDRLRTPSQAASVGHHADTISRHRQASRPRNALPYGVPSGRDFAASQSQVSPAGQALPCFYTPITPRRRERSGLTE